MAEYIGHNEAERIAALLTGRRVVAVDDRAGTLTLDSDVVIRVMPNEGGCSCGAGDYELESLSTVDNAITSVQVIDEERGMGDGEDAHRYRISVYAGGIATDVAVIEGDDGNGYYGTGFQLEVEAVS